MDKAERFAVGPGDIDVSLVGPATRSAVVQNDLTRDDIPISSSFDQSFFRV